MRDASVFSATRRRSMREIDIRKDVLQNVEAQAADNFAGGYRTTFGFPAHQAPWCTGKLKGDVLDKNIRFPIYGSGGLVPRDQVQGATDFRSSEETGAASSKFSDKRQERGAKINTVQYLGIAADEPIRIARHSVPGKVLPLVLAGWDEAYCRKWCEENDLLSPIYTTSARGGCWFCHNQGLEQLRLLRRNYPDLWALLMKWDLDSPTTFHPDGRTVHDLDKRFEMEERGSVPTDNTFRWYMIDQPEQLKIEI